MKMERSKVLIVTIEKVVTARVIRRNVARMLNECSRCQAWSSSTIRVRATTVVMAVLSCRTLTSKRR